MIVRSLYVEGESALHGLHPLTKIAAVAAVLLLAFAREGSREGPMLLLLGLLVLAGGAGVLRPLVNALLRIVLPVLVSLYLLHGVLALATGKVSSEGGWFLTLHRLFMMLNRSEAEAPGTIGVRLLVVVAAILLLLLTTHPGRLVQALVSRGTPIWLGYVVAASLQTVPAALAQVKTVSDAQRVRGFDAGDSQGRGLGSLLARIRAMLPLLGPLMLGMLQSVEEQAMALEARGFGRLGPRTSLVEVDEEPWEPRFRLVVLAVGFGGFLWLRGWVAWGLSWFHA